MLLGNSFTYRRLAIWNSSGNWLVNDNDLVGCYGAYYSFNKSSPYGSATSDNWARGSLVGNTFNHSNGGVKVLWSRGAAFAIGGVVQDPGSGVVVSGVLPPTFTGNTLWYTDVRARDVVGTRWLLSGSTFSNLTITASRSPPPARSPSRSSGPSPTASRTRRCWSATSGTSWPRCTEATLVVPHGRTPVRGR